MDATDLETFEDPELKAALRRALADEGAPAPLRQRLREMAATEWAAPALRPVSKSAPRRAVRPIFRSLTWAAAAIVLIGVGTVGYLAFHRPTPAYAALPAALSSALVARHDACCDGPWHHQGEGVPEKDFTAIGRVLRQKLDHSVLVADLEKDNWAFRGAAICPISQTPSAHLIFERSVPGSSGSTVKQELSVLSLPASLWPGCPAGSKCEIEVARHPIVGLEGKDGLYCLVGSSPDDSLKAADLEKMLTRHQREIVALRPPGESSPVRTTVAELLHDRQ